LTTEIEKNQKTTKTKVFKEEESYENQQWGKNMRKYRFFDKGFAVGIILLLLGTSIISSSAMEVERPSVPASRGTWLYVGGSGPGNYSRIQDAIDDAFVGDTIFVYDDSSPYYEHIIVYKPVHLIGENKATTIINGVNNHEVIKVTTNGMSLSNFTLVNADCGIIGSTNNSIICHNIFKAVQGGGAGIALMTSSNNTIVDNTFNPCLAYYYEVGIAMYYSSNNIISHNIIQGCLYGVGLAVCTHNIIIENTISKNIHGVDLYYALLNVIEKNNFMENTLNAKFSNSLLNRWRKNYWDDWRGIGPKYISGTLPVPWDPWNEEKGIPWMNCDWRPARKPYDSEGWHHDSLL
jgi:parallel beta-helix repeat protein